MCPLGAVQVMVPSVILLRYPLVPVGAHQLVGPSVPIWRGTSSATSAIVGSAACPQKPCDMDPIAYEYRLLCFFGEETI